MKRISLIMLIVIVIYLAIVCIINVTMYSVAAFEKKRSDRLERVDYIVVLGNKLNQNQPSAALLKRLEKAEFLATKYENAQIVVSGGVSRGNTMSEAETMKNYLVSQGVNESRIIVEDRSKSTRENMKYVKEIVGDDSSIMIITNSFHMLRALSIAKEYKLGEVYGCSVENGSISTTVEYFFLEPMYIVANFFVSLFS